MRGISFFIAPLIMFITKTEDALRLERFNGISEILWTEKGLGMSQIWFVIIVLGFTEVGYVEDVITFRLRNDT